MDTHACPNCDGPTQPHCNPEDPAQASKACDRWDCANTDKCRTFGTLDGRRSAVRP